MAAPATVVATSVIANLKLLNRDNYKDWSFRVKTYLLAEDLWDVVEGTSGTPNQEAEFRAWRKKDAKALYAIQSSCGDDTYLLIEGISTAKTAWDTLAGKLTPADQATVADTRFITEAYQQTPNDTDAGLEDGGTMGEVSDNELENFVRIVEAGDWWAAMSYINRHPRSVSSRLRFGRTALHYAFLFNEMEVAEFLVVTMEPEDLVIRDMWGYTALHYAVSQEHKLKDIAVYMVGKNRNILSMAPPFDASSSAFVAQTREKLVHFFYSLNPSPSETLRVIDAADLISTGFRYKNFDVGWDLIQRYPNLAMAENYDGGTPLTDLADMPWAFLSGVRLKFWQQWIYGGIHRKPTRTYAVGIGRRLFRRLVNSVANVIRGLVLVILKLSGNDHIRQMQWTHSQIDSFVQRMSIVTANKEIEQLQGLKKAMFLATKNGLVEYITHLCKANPALQYITYEKGRTMFQFAVECRQEKVYNLTYGFGSFFQQAEVHRTDLLGNNMLHMVGTVSPLAQINHIRGAALQMQRELQWLQELEKVAGPAALDAKNNEQMTPRELFTKGHKELVKAGEISMKDTAKSCTVVGALIVTVMFAAAFTVPGGNNQDTCFPTFLHRKVFTAFIISDAMSLFSSTTSVVTFLGILTSRYAEEDFLISLPRKMILGLLTLFLSMAAMMISFSCALYITLDGKRSIIIPVVMFSCVPIASFIWMQFPFLTDQEYLLGNSNRGLDFSVMYVFEAYNKIAL